MLAEGIMALAQLAGQTVVAAAVTDGWDAARRGDAPVTLPFRLGRNPAEAMTWVSGPRGAAVPPMWALRVSASRCPSFPGLQPGGYEWIARLLVGAEFLAGLLALR